MNKKYLSLSLILVLFTACGSSSSSSKKNDGEGEIDLKNYYPKTSMTKTFISKEGGGENQETTKKHYDAIINVDNNHSTITTTVNTEITEKVKFTDKNITITFPKNKNESITLFRHVDIGDTLLKKEIKDTKVNDLGTITTQTKIECILKSKEEKFQKDDNIYKGDLLKIECVTEGTLIYDIKQSILDAGVGKDLNGSHPIYDTSYGYLKKDLGRVALINDDCLTDTRLEMLINDKTSAKNCKNTHFNYEFYLP